MAVGLKPLAHLHPVPGLRIGTTAAGIKKPGRRDLVVMELAEGAHCAAVFTRNAFCAAPVTLAKEHRARREPRYLLINTGNANAGTGDRGLADARRCCAVLAGQVGVEPETVLPFSTGVIGEPLPVDTLTAALPAAVAALDADGWEDAAYGIMTTDTVPKGVTRRFEVMGEAIIITGIAKGSGMIHPNMATMLGFIATNASIAPHLLQRCLNEAVACSFNSITVDGDTSTNDACLLVATGQSGLAMIESEQSECYTQLRAVVTEVAVELAQAIIRDGEGATKFITIEVKGGASVEECRQVAYTVAHSPLVKTAFFASDPNWGRILAAVGRAGVEQLDVSRVGIDLDEVTIVRNGGRADDYREEAGQRVMARDEITVTIDLGRGSSRATVWTSDLSHEYVRINAEYRT